MKKIVLATLIIGTFILFSLLYNYTNALALLSTRSTDPSLSTFSPPPSVVPTASGATGTPNPAALYKDGTYTGSIADAQWGNVQVQVVIQSGKMANITFLQYPNERSRSVFINSYADPRLISEAIQAQNSTVDAVTGATDSSDAFMQSLSDALSQAQA